MYKYSLNVVKKTLLIVIFLLLNFWTNAQHQKTDSLENLLLKQTEQDTIRVNLLNETAYKLYNIDIDKTLLYAKEARELANKLHFTKGEARSLNIIGIYYYLKANYPKALEFYQTSMQLYEKINDESGISNSLNNIGLIYDLQGNYPKALEYHKKSLELEEKTGDKQGVSRSLSNIGLIYDLQGNYPKAIEYYQNSLKIADEIGDKQGISECFGNIGYIYNAQGDYSKALEYFNNSLKLDEEIGNLEGICLNYMGFGAVYIKTNAYAKALTYTRKALKIANELESLNVLKDINRQLAEIYAATNDYKNAYEHYVAYKQLNDSIYNEENIKKITGLEYQYKHEKEKQAIALEQAKKDALQAEEAKLQKIIRNTFIAGFVFVLILALVVFRNFLNKKKANELLQKQKAIIEKTNDELKQTNEKLNLTLKIVNHQKNAIEKQKTEVEIAHRNITASINYALFIQNAALPSQKKRDEILTEHFVLFKPRDIVSGDFFWIKKIDNYIALAAADCTGHGVPGAFLSMLGISFLNDIVRQKEVTQANHVLEKMRKRVKETLEQTGSRGASKDGMDMAFCIIDRNTNVLQYAGANNPLYIYRNGELVEFKPNRQPIGIYVEEKPFTNHKTQLQKGDVIYLFTDGYIDQFGGRDDSKFKTKRFKKLLAEIQHLAMTEQQTILEQTFDNWRGNNEQLDDVLIIGLRI